MGTVYCERIIQVCDNCNRADLALYSQPDMPHVFLDDVINHNCKVLE